MAPRWYVAPVQIDTGHVMGPGVWRRTYWGARRAQRRMNDARTNEPAFYGLPPFRFLVIDAHEMYARQTLLGENVDGAVTWL